LASASTRWLLGHRVVQLRPRLRPAPETTWAGEGAHRLVKVVVDIGALSIAALRRRSALPSGVDSGAGAQGVPRSFPYVALAGHRLQQPSSTARPRGALRLNGQDLDWKGAAVRRPSSGRSPMLLASRGSPPGMCCVKAPRWSGAPGARHLARIGRCQCCQLDITADGRGAE
jgi:hypothetical protein